MPEEEEDEDVGTRGTGPTASNAPTSRGGTGAGGGGGNAIVRGTTLGENVGDVAIVPATLERKLTLADAVEGGAEAESLRWVQPVPLIWTNLEPQGSSCPCGWPVLPCYKNLQAGRIAGRWC